MKFLHEQHVLVIPGGGFDWHEDLRFRIVMLPEAGDAHQGDERYGVFPQAASNLILRIVCA